MTEHATLLHDFRSGRRAALARAISSIENEAEGFQDFLDAALRDGARGARRVGVTGPPGAGKSTLVAELARSWAERGETVGVVAVDPSSPFTGGALLGDRIRMSDLATRPGVFIRSMATRGSLGGLATATRETLDLLEAFGFARLLVETVGVGQTELEIAAAAETVIVVLVPESGDAIQAMKAGLTEIADVFVVNKADRPGADRLAHDLAAALALRADRSGWTPPVLRTVAQAGDGVAALDDAVERHRVWLEASGEMGSRRRARAERRVRESAERAFLREVWGNAWVQERIASGAAEVADGRNTPYSVAREIVSRVFDINGGK